MKKSSSIAFHFVREGAARNEWRTTYLLNTNLNPADIILCTKSLPSSSGEKRSRFTSYFLHYVDSLVESRGGLDNFDHC